jgi:hypothetical protein
MTPSRSIVKMNKTESVVIVKWSGGVSFSIVDNNELDDLPILSTKNLSPIKVKDIKRSDANPIARPTVEIENEFKNGDSVLYDGKPFNVVRAYVYKGKPYCILSDKRQVSALKLTINKPKK